MKTAETLRRGPDVVRFFLVALGGLIIDIALATALIEWAGLADIPAAAIGLFAGMIFNYFLHLTWTFQNQSRAATVRHFLKFAIGVGATLVIRALVLHLIATFGWQEVLPSFVRLSLGAGASFVASYAINRFVIFTPNTDAAQ